MANLLRMGYMIGLLVFVALAAALVQPEWAQDLGLEQLNAAALQEQLFGEQVRQKDLQERDQALLKRLDKKQAIVKDLIAGQLSLFEAAALFRHVNEEFPNDLIRLPDSPEQSEECLCCQVIDWARVEVQSRPGTAPADLAERLKETLRRHKERNGMVVLPEVVVTP